MRDVGGEREKCQSGKVGLGRVMCIYAEES